MTPERLNEAIAFGREQHGIEFKGPGPRTDKQLLARVIRAMLGMANRSDGGAVVIGVSEREKVLDPCGLADDDAKTWNYDETAMAVSQYADPGIQFHVCEVSLDSKVFIWIQVNEFEDTPVLCKADYQSQARGAEHKRDINERMVLRNGACYVRGRADNRTVEVPTHVEMRDLLERASERKVRAMIQRFYRVGLLRDAPSVPDAASQFDEERKDGGLLHDSTVRITSRGYWFVVVRPQSYVKERVERLSDVERMVRDSAVSLRGWDFPHIDSQEPVKRGANWVAQSVDWDDYLEHWRAYKSGQFVFVGNMRGDWRDPERVVVAWGRSTKGPYLSAEDAIYKLTEIFEFSARYAGMLPNVEFFSIEVWARGLDGRVLTFAPPRYSSFLRDPAGRTAEWHFSKHCSRAALISEAKEMAIQASIRLVELFNWDTQRDVVASIQDELIQYRR